MRITIVLILAACFVLVQSKNNVKTLTESLGQEVIEVGRPLKDLSGDIEEEPSAEIEDATSSTIQQNTRSDTRRSSFYPKKVKDIDKIDGKKQDDEETRIEKELADLYKDNADYKDSSENTIKNKSKADDKPIARNRDNFQFQPETQNKNAIERFRTSVDEISCEKRVTKKLDLQEKNNSASVTSSLMFVILSAANLFY